MNTRAEHVQARSGHVERGRVLARCHRDRADVNAERPSTDGAIVIGCAIPSGIANYNGLAQRIVDRQTKCQRRTVGASGAGVRRFLQVQLPSIGKLGARGDENGGEGGKQGAHRHSAWPRQPTIVKPHLQGVSLHTGVGVPSCTCASRQPVQLYCHRKHVSPAHHRLVTRSHGGGLSMRSRSVSHMLRIGEHASPAHHPPASTLFSVSTEHPCSYVRYRAVATIANTIAIGPFHFGAMADRTTGGA